VESAKAPSLGSCSAGRFVAVAGSAEAQEERKAQPSAM